MKRQKSNSNPSLIIGGPPDTLRQGFIFSLMAHTMLVIGLLWLKGFLPAGGPMIIAAGSGEGGNGGAVEVGIVGGAEWLRFAPTTDVATLGHDSQISPAVEDVAQRPDVANETTAETVPRPDSEIKKPLKENTTLTDRPVASDSDKPYVRDTATGGASSTSALVGVPGSPFPVQMQGGVGIGVGARGPDGIPGGSEYGRRLQQALMRYYRLTPTDPQHAHFVIVQARIARSGHLLSVENGRLRPEAVVQKSGNIVVDNRVAGALLELDRQPIPFPPDFLLGVRDAVVEIYFQY